MLMPNTSVMDHSYPFLTLDIKFNQAYPMVNYFVDDEVCLPAKISAMSV
jgi:hypothetical protein